MSRQLPEDARMKRVRELVEDIHIGMITTSDSLGHLNSAPLPVMQMDADIGLWFFVNEGAAIVRQLEPRTAVTVNFSDSADGSFVSVTGHAHLARDRAIIDQLWSAIAKPWYPRGKDDPSLMVLKVIAETAECWDPHTKQMVRFFEMAQADEIGAARPIAPAKRGVLLGELP